MANLAKKISLIIFSAVIIIFISGNVFADNTMLHKAADSARNGVGHTENVIQDTSNTVRDMSGNIVAIKISLLLCSWMSFFINIF